MGTTQFNSSEYDETLEEKSVHFESTMDQTASKQGNKENGNVSEPEIYLLISHRGRKHGPRGGRRIGLFGPFGPRGPKGFGFSHGGPHRDGHPHERHHDKVDRSDVHRGPPHARGFRHRPYIIHDPEKEEFIDVSESERGYSPHRGMRRFGPGSHGRRGPTSESGSEFHREPRRHGDPSRRPHSFGTSEHGHGPRGGPHDRFEAEERIRPPYHHPHREHGRGPRGGPRGRFETEERVRSPYHHPPREHGRGPQGGPRGRLETEERVRSPYHHPPRKHGRGPQGGPRGRFENEDRIRSPPPPHHHHHHPQEHGRGSRGGPRGGFETEEHVHRPSWEHGHGPYSREHGFGSRDRFEVEENVKQFHRGKPENHEYGPHSHGKLHGHGYDPRERFEAEENVKEFHGKHERDGLPFGNEHGRRNERGSPSRDRHSPRGRFESKSGYFSDHSEYRGPHRREFSPHGDRRFEHSRHGSESEYESDYSNKSFGHHRSGRRFEHGRRGPNSHHSSEVFRNHHGFGSRGGRGGPRLHRYGYGSRHGMHRFPHHRPNKPPLTPEELAENIALLNSMGFTSENDSHYEELLRKFNGRIGRVVDILLREQKKEKDDNGENKDRDGWNNEGGSENEKTPSEDYDVVEEKTDE